MGGRGGRGGWLQGDVSRPDSRGISRRSPETTDSHRGPSLSSPQRVFYIQRRTKRGVNFKSDTSNYKVPDWCKWPFSTESFPRRGRKINIARAVIKTVSYFHHLRKMHNDTA